MKRSERRILTTHTGSLPRSPEMQVLLRLREGQDELDQAAFDADMSAAQQAQLLAAQPRETLL